MTYASFVGLNRFLGSRFVLFEKKKESLVHRVRRRVRVWKYVLSSPYSQLYISLETKGWKYVSHGRSPIVCCGIDMEQTPP